MVSIVRTSLFNSFLYTRSLCFPQRLSGICHGTRNKAAFERHDRSCHSDVVDSDEVVKEICQNDHVLEKKLRILMLEVEVMRQDGRCAPDALQMKHWKHLVELPTKSQRSNYLRYLFKNEKSRENEKLRKEAKRRNYEMQNAVITKDNPDDIEYGITHQSLFIRIRDKSMNNYDNFRALQAMLYGQKIVFDCSYGDNMVWREAVNAAKQLMLLFGCNRIHKEPFDIHLCNVQLQGAFMKQLESNIPTLFEPWFPLNIHTKSYLDVFPKEDLVYLTPHCREELTEYDHNAVYIIGCMVDKANNEPLSLARAKRDGVKMAKLPLDRYLEWGTGSKKSLNINHVASILLDLKVTGDWNYALKHVPRRKLLAATLNKIQSKHNFSVVDNEIQFNAPAPPKLMHRIFTGQKPNSRPTLYDDDKF